ncbi:MAG TPA: SH3 domain-containing protein, partial [Caldilineaceae bacterium]|nr:SH3 domain-containing protein [Caldilineaceae bacterium]
TATQEITAAEVPSAAIPTTEITTTSSVTGADALTESAPTTTTAPAEAAAPQLVVVNEVVNARGGPGTNYGIVGSVSRDQTFEIVGKNPEGTWWQFCCVNGQTAWVFGELVRAENAEAVPVAQDIPAPPEPLAAAPPPAEAAPAQPAPEPAPTNTPEPQPAAPPAQAVNAGPCGGDDGCKFRISGGPTVRPNGGFELKFQLLFKHSGVDGGQPQGDYRLGIEKDGQLITYFGDVRSIALTRNQGPMGDYNYEAKLNASELPGGTVAGAYFFWVLDGNRERDSEVFRLDLAPDQGEVWIEFDQG